MEQMKHDVPSFYCSFLIPAKWTEQHISYSTKDRILFKCIYI